LDGRHRRHRGLGDDPHWYKDAVIYELHIRAFHDKNGDGIGDLPGLVDKLDYLADLGVTALWLLPFYPSPLKDDGYDIAEYTQVNPSYGTLRDFRHLLGEAHARGLRVITELVLNHTSDQHPWLQRARRSPKGSRWRDFYVWSDTDRRYADARIIFQDFERSNWTWDPVAGAHYWHRFYHHQPDLNFDNPAVHRALLRVVDQWLGMGVDGLRLDAVPYLYEREGTNCENLQETHAFLRELRAHVDANHPNRLLLAEANQWPEDAVAYFGQGDECHMNFHFPLMPRLFMGLRMEDRFPIVDIIKQTPELPPSCQWALFLRNHDELTLEMVTDQERDYMWRVYAHDARARINLGIRRRLAPLLGNDRRKIELMMGLLFSLPGTPVLYYGDEIGMGDNIWLGDRNGVRTPMQWSGDKNAGFSQAHPQSLFLPVIIDPENHYETVNVETQQKNPSSLLWWTKRLIALRKRYRAFGRGGLDLLYPDNPKVLAFVRRHAEETILVVANLSRYVQGASLDLSRHAGAVPVELFGRAALPPVEEGRPYFLTLGPHALHWFALEPRAAREAPVDLAAPAPPVLAVEPSWEALLADDARAALEAELPGFLRTRRWFGGRTAPLRGVRIADAVPIPPEERPDEAAAAEDACLLLVTVDFVDRDPETYSIPLALARGERGAALVADRPHLVFARVRRPGLPDDARDDALLIDGLVAPSAAQALLECVARRGALKGERGKVHGAPAGKRLAMPEGGPPPASLVGVEQTNTSAVFGHRWVLKLFRSLEPGQNPDVELGRFLTARGFDHAARVEGELTYRGDGEVLTLGVLAAFVPNEGDAWAFTLDALGRYYERVLAEHPGPPPAAPNHVLEAAVAEPTGPIDPLIEELAGIYPPMARLLGDRTARLHLCLASDAETDAMRPEPYAAHAQRSIMQGVRTQLTRTFDVLRRQAPGLPEPCRAEAALVLGLEERLHERARELLGLKLTALRIRCHGDLHLGQVLYTGKDFVFIDFEGEPSRPLSERRLKRSSLRDVAGLLRSLHYAAHAALDEETIRPEDRERLRPWADAWSHVMGAALLGEYLRVAAGAPFMPAVRTELRLLLDLHLLEKALYELVYELDHRPSWVGLPLQGIRSVAGV
jgi:maltose alpha-D-glucosyltransferase/alpha-amylase